MKVIIGSDMAKIIISQPPKLGFRDNYNNHLKSLQVDIKSANEPLRTILTMQIENEYKAFIL